MSRNARDIFSQGTWIFSRASRDISRWNILAVSRLCQCETIQWHFRYTWKRTRAISRSWIFQPFHLIRTKKMIFSQCLEFHWKISYPRWPVPKPLSKSVPRKILRAASCVLFRNSAIAFHLQPRAFTHCVFKWTAQDVRLRPRDCPISSRQMYLIRINIGSGSSITKFIDTIPWSMDLEVRWY